MPACGLDSAAFAPDRVAPGRTSLKHAKVAQGKVILRRILRIQPSQNVRDLFGGFPVGSGTVGPSEVPRKSVDVGVDGDEQDRRGEVPKAQIDAVGRPDHPAKVQEQPLGCAAPGGIRQQVERRAVHRRQSSSASDLARKPGQRRLEVALVEPLEGRTEATLGAGDLTSAPQKARDVLAPVHAMSKSTQAALEGSARGEGVLHPLEHLLDLARQHTHVAERHRCCEQADDLLYERLTVAMHDADGVGSATGFDVTFGPNSVQRGLEPRMVGSDGQSSSTHRPVAGWGRPAGGRSPRLRPPGVRPPVG